MAKLFIGIALVVMLATAALGFLLKGKVDALQASRKEAVNKVSNAEGQAKTAKNDAEKAQKEAKDATDKLDAANTQAATATKAAEEAKKAVDEKQLVIDAKDKEIAAAKNAPPVPVADPQVQVLKGQLDEVTAQNGTLTKERDEAKAMFDSQVAKDHATEQQLADLQKEKRNRINKLGLNGLQGRVLAVNAGWNFVVLSVGDKQGVAVNAPLLVVRNNQPIAKLRITSVEPSTSIADVLPGSVPRGVSVQPGDTVIFQGRTVATEPDNKPAADVPVTVPPVPPLP